VKDHPNKRGGTTRTRIENGRLIGKRYDTVIQGKDEKHKWGSCKWNVLGCGQERTFGNQEQTSSATVRKERSQASRLLPHTKKKTPGGGEEEDEKTNEISAN